VTRLPPQPSELIDRGSPLSFTFDGKPVEGFEGDTIGSALYAAGQRTFSRSFKYHRRRGLLCCAGQCPNCLVQVDDAPGVRACTEPVRAGMRAEHMNASPSLDFDVMRATDLVGGPFTPPGFYYKTFIRPRRLWPLYEKVLRHAAGLGRLRKEQPDREWRTEYRRRHADVLVVGGGAAGLTAAATAAELGADVLLADEGPQPGGRLLAEDMREHARELAERARRAGAELLANAPALGAFDGLVPVWQGETLHQVRAQSHVYATGAIEQPLLFPGNDLPGVMLSGGARRLISLYAVQPGTRAVVAASCDRGLDAALALLDAGVELACVADLRTNGVTPPAQELMRRGVELIRGATVLEARGRGQVQGAVLGRPEPPGGRDADRAPAAGPWDGDGRERVVACDLLVVSGGAAPAISLLSQTGARTTYDADGGFFALAELPAGVHAAGEVAGKGELDAAELSGAVAGAEAAHALGLGGADSRARAATGAEQLRRRPGRPSQIAVAPAPTSDRHGRCFACLCEDVTAKDIHLSVAEGYDSIELSKRYTTTTMGPCQGRMCQLPAARLIARETGQDLGQVGGTTARPPWQAVPMGALAGRPFEPAKRSSIHGRHRELGANVMWAGDWRRAYDYGDPRGEAIAVHEAAGLIDVATLGKLIVRGPDAGEFLDRLYPNRLSNLKPGRIRYGVITSDAGRIIDDGTICRLDDETFYVTTTSSGAGAVYEWFSWWLADWRLGVHLTDVTQGLAAVNLAGPRSREILGRVSDVDCSSEAFAYLDGRQAEVAGARSLILRIGFVGEVGYEIHFPAAHGEHVWDALLDAGAPHGLRPFGLEPQRLLRLQKMHILVGQDTDSESTPYGAAMPWIVKLDKEQDFIGRWALERAADEAPETALVGFTLADGQVPTEGAAVLPEAGDGQVGQVTSARHSPQLGQVIGMAWVPAALAKDGAEVTISDDGRRLRARVVTKPFYDAEGEVLRS
jgi:sarcosine oxidase subunit alpha